MVSNLKTQKEEDRAIKSAAIKEKLFKSQVFKKAKTIMFYLSFDGEVDTREMIQEAQKLGKIVAVPVCKKHRIIRPCILRKKSKLEKGPYGVCEPAVKTTVGLKDLDLVVVPGIAFSEQGCRLGRGRGCYDYFLKRVPQKTHLVGLAFDFQILPDIPTTKRDFCVDRVIFA